MIRVREYTGLSSHRAYKICGTMAMIIQMIKKYPKTETHRTIGSPGSKAPSALQKHQSKTKEHYLSYRP